MKVVPLSIPQISLCTFLIPFPNIHLQLFKFLLHFKLLEVKNLCLIYLVQGKDQRKHVAGAQGMFGE